MVTAATLALASFVFKKVVSKICMLLFLKITRLLLNMNVYVNLICFIFPLIR